MRLRAIPLRAALCKATAAALLVVAASAPGLAGAVVFTEVGDAGQTPLTAQDTGNTGSALTSIFGSLFSDDDADVFVISITNALAFSASTVNVFSNLLDTQLFLFSATGAPIFANDDAAGGLSLQSTLPAGSAFGPITTGRYLIGVSASFNEAVNAVNQVLFAPGGLSTDLRGPNGSLQPAVLSGFSGGGFGSGNYRIDLTGAAVAVTPIPEPSLWLLLAVGGVGIPVLNRRRRALRVEARPAS